MYSSIYRQGPAGDNFQGIAEIDREEEAICIIAQPSHLRIIFHVLPVFFNADKFVYTCNSCGTSSLRPTVNSSRSFAHPLLLSGNFYRNNTRAGQLV